MESSHISLLELNKLVQSRLYDAFPETYWIVAEIAQHKENFNGHCYLELTETTGKSNKIVAQAKAMIWANTWRMLKPYFETTTKQKFREGLKVLIRVKIDFHEIYGLSLGIFDIDPSYTVGDLAIKKAEIVQKLKEDGIFDMNRELEIPLVPQRIAIVSSETAAGYTDFVTHLANNNGNYKFCTKLFQSYMQGDRTEQSVIDALDHINNEIHNFDIVVIIRGGGSQTDLSAFDSYWLAANIAQFPIPIFTGIGHEENESIADMVAHTALKTPTAVANYIIDNVKDFEGSILDLEHRTVDCVTDIIDQENNLLNTLSNSFPVLIRNQVQNHKYLLSKQTSSLALNIKGIMMQSSNKLSVITEHVKKSCFQTIKEKDHWLSEQYKSLNKTTHNYLEKQKNRLNILHKTNELSNPLLILKKGFSISLYNGKIIKNPELLQENDLIETILYSGKIKSKITLD